MRRWLKLDPIRELGRQYPLLCFLLLVLLLSTALFNRYILIIMGLWSFLAGMVTFYCLLGPESLLPNFVVSIKPKIKSFKQEALFPLGHSCAVCGKTKCKRHRPSLLLEKYQPWFDLKVPSKVDVSLSEILELVLENFVYRWYRKKTDDEAFIDELRVTLRFVAAVLVRRAQKVDLASLITEKLLKVATKHIEITSKARQKVKGVEYLQQAALGEYGPDLHVALGSRRDELLYLRKLTELMFQYILPPKASDCRSLTSLLREVLAGSVFLPSMDYLADPDTANRLILLFFNNSNNSHPAEEATKPTSALVPFLQMFSDARYENHSALKLDLKGIREQQDLLFRFMNFLKQEGAVHVLQFYLTVEEFNVKILCPEMTDSEKRLLHEEVKKIYETYCLEESVDKIRFDPVVVEEIRNIAQGPYEEVVNLQTMACLFEAHERVLSLLESVFIPMFCDSDEYFHQLLRPASVSPAKSCRVSRSRRGSPSRVSRIGSKIKGVFKSSTTMEGTMLPSSGPVEEEDNMAEEAMMVLEDDFPDPVQDEACVLGTAPRDLSAWSVTIPCICDDDDDAKSEQVPVFCLIVERNDRKAAVGHKAENWCVYRRYTEFYVLESKLTEFHGPFPDAQLPSKRIIGPKNHEFLSSKREEFQEYLQKLLQHPELSNSQLLADFLSPHMESQFRTKRLPDVNLGKIFKAVDSKLTIEKGQHLEPFIKSFRNSCKSPKPKANSPELTVLSPTSGIDKRLFNGLFKNNANLSEMAEKRHNQNCFVEMITVEGVYDYLMHIGRVVFHIPDWLHHLLMGGRILFKNTLEAYTDHCLQAKLDRVAQEYRLVSLITLLRDAVFREHSQPRSTADIQMRAKRTFEEMLSYIPDLLEKCIGEKAKYEGVRLLFDGLQQPVLNKQLTYVLLDIVIQELFPELNKVKLY